MTTNVVIVDTDVLIDASAIYLDEPFVSKNQRDYRFITNLDLLPYPEPFPEEN